MSFKLITERANFQALKAVLASVSFSGSSAAASASTPAAPFDLQVTLTTTGLGQQPTLEGPSLKTPLYDCNEMAKLFLQRETTLEEEQWAEWEAQRLVPGVAPLYTTRKVSPSVLSALQHVNEHLGKVPTIVRDPPKGSVAELILWCSLLPALCENGLLPDSDRDALPNLTKWFAAFQEANADSISNAFTLLKVQEACDFLRVRQVFRITPPAEKTFYVTTPIYYVNASPHIGHVYSTLVADALAKYHWVKGEDVYFMTGTDEHGQKIATAAADKGIKPYEFTTAVSAEFKKCFEEMHFKYDRFIRTTDKDHMANVTEIWNKLQADGDIFLGKYEGWYCVSDEAYLTEQNVADGVDKAGKPCKVSKESGHPCIWMTEDNYKFKLSKYQDRLLEWYTKNPGCIVPEFRRREMISFVSSGLQDLSISRSKEKCTWGIPVPGNPDHVMYVWLDALSNYFTGARSEKGELGDWRALKRWPADVHVIGKDILKFHAVYWPAFLMAAGLPLPKKIVAHGWWTKDKQKISKSLGNVFDPLEKAAKYGHDALRYFLLRESAFADDGDYSDKNMSLRLNNELADTLGNLLMRCLSPKINVSQSWPALGAEETLTERDTNLIKYVSELPGVVDHYFSIPDIQRALIATFDVLNDLNQYANEMAPWKMVAEEPKGSGNLVVKNPERLATVLYILMEGMRLCALMLTAVLPETTPKIFDQLGVPQELRRGVDAMRFGLIKPGTKLGSQTTEVLFVKDEEGRVLPKKNPKKKAGGGGGGGEADAEAA